MNVILGDHGVWRLTYSDGITKKQFTLPEATHAEIFKLWSEVISAEPFNSVKAGAEVSIAPMDEKVFQAVTQRYQFDAEEIELAKRAYGNDAESGKTLAALRAEFPTDTEAPAAGDVRLDKRRTCNECANLDAKGHCLAAKALGASRHYRPVQDRAIAKRTTRALANLSGCANPLNDWATLPRFHVQQSKAAERLRSNTVGDW